MKEENEIALRRQVEELKSELSSVAYAISHDVQAPVRGITSFLAFLREECAESISDEGTKYLSYLDELSQQMTSMVKDLVQYSRVTSAELKLQRENIWSLFKEVVMRHDKFADVNVVVQEPVSEFVREIDTELFLRMVHELIDNASTFMALSEREPCIEIGVMYQGDTPILYMHDNGIGFDDEYGEGAFDIFSKVHEQRLSQGNGIGLALVRRIVHLHNGKVRLLSQPDEGTTVQFTLWPDVSTTE